MASMRFGKDAGLTLCTGRQRVYNPAHGEGASSGNDCDCEGKMRNLILMIGPIGMGLGLLAGGMVGCVAETLQTGTLYERLQNEDPAVRIQAAVQAGNEKDSQAVPLLVDRLSDTESEVQLFAGMALEKITGGKLYDAMGWKFYDSPQKQSEAIGKWRGWVKKKYGKSGSQSIVSPPS